MRLNAYYFGFDSTGIAEIDMVLSAVATAGKAYHHTDQWTEPTGEYEGVTGETPRDWIQNAAKAAAAEILRLRAEVGDMHALLSRGIELFGGDDEKLRKMREALTIVTYAKGAGPDFDWDAYYADTLAAAEDALAAVPIRSTDT